VIFTKIDYINLLPFYVFIKRNIKSSQIKAIINHKKSYPSNINKKFKMRQIDASFISSIVSTKAKCTNLGIVAKAEVLSVLVFDGVYEKDLQSNTSNILAKILKIDGKVIIGDKALYHYYNSIDKNFIDLAQIWNEKYNLPFVFALLCFNKQGDYLNILAKKFIKTKVKIPQYILKQYSRKTNITTKQIKYYLTKISYQINHKEKKSLKLFLKLAKEFKV